MRVDSSTGVLNLCMASVFVPLVPDAFTAGSVIFAGSSGRLSQDNASLFWDDTNDRLGVGTATPGSKVHVWRGASGGTPSSTWNFLLESSTNSTIAMLTPNTAFGQIIFGDPELVNSGTIRYTHSIDALGINSADSIRFTLAGNERIRIDNAGNVGMGGITDPTHPLAIAAQAKVVGTDEQLGLRSLRSALVTGELIGGQSYRSNDSNLTAPGTIVGLFDMIATATHTASVLDSAFVWHTTKTLATSEKMRLDADGQLGIGTTSPVSSLAVAGDRSTASWTATGKNFSVAANTLTDTTGSGVISSRVASSFGTPTLAASSAVDVVQAATVYIAGSPVAGTNTTIRETSALLIGGPTTMFASSATPGLAQSHLRLRSPNVGIVSGDQLGMMSFVSNDTNLTSPGTAVTSIQSLAEATHTASVLSSGIAFSTTSTLAYAERMRINAAGNLGVGQTVPAAKIHQDSGDATATAHKFTAGTTTGILSTDGFDVGIDASGNAELRQREALPMNFFTNNAQAMTILSAGNVGIGQTSPTAAKLVVETDGAVNSILSMGYGTGFFGQVLIAAARGTQASPTATQSGDVIGSISFQGWDTGRSNGAAITAVAAAEWGTAGDSSDTPTNLKFLTSPDGSQTPLDRLIILSTGDVGINTTAPTAKLHQDGGDATATAHKFTAGSTTGATATDGFDVGIDASGNAELRQRENLAMNFLTNNTQRMSISNAGVVNIGGLTVSLPVFTDGSKNLTSSGTVPIANGGTGQATKAAGFDALSPMTTGGDIIYGGASGTGTRLANGSAGQVLTSNGTTLAPSWQTVSGGTPVAPIVASYNGQPTGTIDNSGTQTTTLPTLIVDSDSAYSGGTYTIPTDGNYYVNAQLAITATMPNANQASGVSIAKNGTTVASNYISQGGDTAAATRFPHVSTVISCVAGDLITVRNYSDGSSLSFNAAASWSYFTIHKIN